MKYAYSAPTRNEEETLLLFSRFRPLGYEGLQLKWGQYAPFLDTPSRFNQEYRALPGAASALITGLDVLDPEAGPRFRRLLRFARETGSERIIVCLEGRRDMMQRADIEAVARATAVLGREALEDGVKLSVHNHAQSPLMHRGDFDLFYAACPPGTVGLTLDTAHAVKSGIADLAELIRGCAALIDNVHLKDYAASEWRVLGRGEIDFAPVFAALKEVGYSGWISTDEESGADLGEAMEHCIQFMKSGMEL